MLNYSVLNFAVITYIRRWFAKRKPFPVDWQIILERDVPVYTRLSDKYRNLLRDRQCCTFME